MKFYTQYERPGIDVCPHEEHPDKGLVETSGYRNTEQIVKELLQAGQNLVMYREAEYAGDAEVPEDAPANVMRLPLDARLELKRLRERVWEANRAGKRLEAEKAIAEHKALAEKAKDPSNGDS